ncbi:hypothetical protein D8Y22_19770 [Salinadaptatus halalkaliphilus]|uniref:DUF8168 domain-containing protein n=1 Tax=Salinadaptatus halalkaliphilus TaxID=2419781 RepID=A0A4V3VKV0_9EURY|nr:hypothetical protein [Salinadaptatus halalkaliphilus]THE63147.1 hypothetical protein D8Y22_19770 [Salinadaptatus halalkaliphilus]
MGKNTTLSDFQGDGDQDVMVAAYRHDAHKMNGHPHEYAPETFAGVPVNQTVPHGADDDASALSRPSGQPEPTVENHETLYRLSLIEGESRYDPQEFTRNGVESAVRELLTEDDPETMHRTWLDSNVVSGFTESVYYPYTSLKYHTLLVAALLDNYRDGHEFVDLRLVVDDADEIVPHRTVYAGQEFALRIDIDAQGQPSARLGSRPWRLWASAWNRLEAHPLDTAHDKYDMVLNANLRRIGSWSTALQYIEDFREVFDQ